MKLQISKTALEMAVKNICRVINSKNALPILGGVKVLISYADTTAGNKGTIYRAANYQLIDRLRADFYLLPSG